MSSVHFLNSVIFTEQVNVMLTSVNVCTEFIFNLEAYVSATTCVPRRKHVKKKSSLNSYPASISTKGKTKGVCPGSFLEGPKKGKWEKGINCVKALSINKPLTLI